MPPAVLIAAVRRCGFDVVLTETGPALRRLETVGAVPGELMAALKARRADVVAYLAAPPGRREMVAVCEELDDLVERSGVPGTVPFLAALAVRAVELHAAGDLDGLHTLRRVLTDELPRLRAEHRAAAEGAPCPSPT